MSINRNSFLEAFARITPNLNLIFLNHLGDPSKLLNDTTAIEMLADKTSAAAFIGYCKTHPLVKELVKSPQYRRTNFLIKFMDGSEIKFCLIQNIIRKTLLFLDIAAIKKSAHINEFGMLIPANEHHFEYMILKCQFNKQPLTERYRNYFTNFQFSARAAVFKYIQGRYNLVFNTLEDLYTPKPNMLLSIMIGLRAEKANTLFKMLLRGLELGLFNLFGKFTKKETHIPSQPVYVPELPVNKNTGSVGQAVS